MVKRYNVTTGGMVEVGLGSWVHTSDYDALAAQCSDLRERLAAAESREVCTVAHDNVETCGYCQRDAVAARLAAAPELLDVVLALLHVSEHGPHDPSPLDENSPLIDAARAAIAKAEGLPCGANRHHDVLERQP